LLTSGRRPYVAPMSWRVIRGVVLSVPIVAGIGLRAWAQDPPPESPPPESPPPESPPPAFVAPPPGYEPGQAAYGAPIQADPPPTFMTLDRMDPHTRVGLQVGLNKIDQFSIGDQFVMRFNPYGQYVFPGQTGGVYGQLPIARLFNSIDGFNNGEGATGYGNFELGGFYMPMGNSDLILRAGLIAATGTDSGAGVYPNAVSVYERMTDFLLVAPNYTSARLSASTVQQQAGVAFFRADLGFDFVLDRPSTMATTTPPTVFFRANVAGGFRLGDVVDLTAELVNVAAVNGNSNAVNGLTNRFIHTAAVGLRTTGLNQAHLGMVFPLDEDIRGEVWIVSTGYQRAFN
jgi:hypothetical protein